MEPETLSPPPPENDSQSYSNGLSELNLNSSTVPPSDLFFDQCCCHSRESKPNCPFAARRLSFVSKVKDEDAVKEILQALSEKKTGSSNIHAELELEFSLSALESNATASIECSQCKSVAREMLKRILKEPKYMFVVDVIDLSKEGKVEKVTWQVSAIPEKPDWFRASLPTKSKKDVTTISSQIQMEKVLLDYLTEQSSGNRILPDFLPGNGSAFPDAKTVFTQLVEFAQNMEPLMESHAEVPQLLELVDRIDRMVEATFVGFSFMSLLTGRDWPKEARDEFIRLKNEEINTFQKMLSMFKIQMSQMQSAIFRLCEAYLRAMEKHFKECGPALTYGCQIGSDGPLGSYFFRKTAPHPRMFTKMSELLLKYQPKGLMNPMNFTSSFIVPEKTRDWNAKVNEVIHLALKISAQSFPSLLDQKPGMVALKEKDLFKYFLGPLKVIDHEDEFLKILANRRKATRWVSPEVKNLFGLNHVPERNLDDAANRFWDVLLNSSDLKVAKKYLRLVEQQHKEFMQHVKGAGKQDDAENGGESMLFPPEELFSNSYMALFHLEAAWKEIGGLDWILGRFSENPRCLVLPDDAECVPLSHVMGRLFVKETVKRLQEFKTREKEALLQAEKMQQALLDEGLDEKSSSGGARKSKKKKPSAVKQPSGVKQTPLETVTPSSTNVVSSDESKIKIMNNDEKSQKTQEQEHPSTLVLVHDSVADAAAAVMDHSAVADFQDNFVDDDEDAWESVSSKKKASKKTLSSTQKSSNVNFSEEWQIRGQVLLVRILQSNFGYVMGDKGKTLNAICTKSGCRIDVLDSEKGVSTRIFRIRGSSETAIRKAASLMKERIDNQGGAPMDGSSERRIKVLKAATPKILGDRGRLVMQLEKETNCKISLQDCIPPEPEASVVIIIGSSTAVTKCYSRLAVYGQEYVDRQQQQRKATMESNSQSIAAVSDPPSSDQSIATVTSSPSQEDAGEEQAQLEMVLAMSEREEEQRMLSKREAQTAAAAAVSSAQHEDVVQNGGVDHAEAALEVHEGVGSNNEETKVEISPEDMRILQEKEDAKFARSLMENEEKDIEFPPLGSSSQNGFASPARQPVATSQQVKPRPSQQQPAPPKASPLEEIAMRNMTTEWSGSRLTVHMPKAFFGKVMGTGGKTLHNIQKQTKTRIDHNPEEDGRDKHVRKFYISGATKSAVDSAYKLMVDAIGYEKSYAIPAQVQSKMFVDNGRFIREYEDLSGAKIMFHPNPLRDGRKLITLSGSQEAVRKCKFLFEQLVVGFSLLEASRNLKYRNAGLTIPDPPSFASNLTGGNSEVDFVPSGIKGLSNSRGENSCFLNVVVQALFHCTSFSEEMLHKFSSNHPRCRAQEKPAGKCLVCALINTFRALSSSEEGTFVSSVALREAVAAAFEGSFDLGNMEDAAEAFEHVLGAVHSCIVDQEPGEGAVCNCLVHRSFASYVVEGVSCTDCISQITSSNPLLPPNLMEYCKRPDAIDNARIHRLMQIQPRWSNLVQYVFAAEIASHGKLTFEEKVKKSIEVNPMSCPACDTPGIEVQRVVTRVPQSVISLGVVWASESPDPDSEIRPVLESISHEFDLAALSPIRTVDGAKDLNLKSYKASLRGVICFNRKHYVACFRKRTSNDWFEFDDATVKPIGPSWSHALKTILGRRFQPVVLFYEVKSPVM